MASQLAQPVRLVDHGITREWGYMQTSDPVAHLSAANQEWDELATDLPKHLMGADFRKTVQQMRPFDVSALQGEGEIRRAMLALSYIGQAYQWSDVAPAHTMPAVLAQPWFKVGQLV
ncbi:MAG: hypothetical protein ACO32W_08125, partial [Ilumatobacteraceae bacterium]